MTRSQLHGRNICAEHEASRPLCQAALLRRSINQRSPIPNSGKHPREDCFHMAEVVGQVEQRGQFIC